LATGFGPLSELSESEKVELCHSICGPQMVAEIRNGRLEGLYESLRKILADNIPWFSSLGAEGDMWKNIAECARDAYYSAGQDVVKQNEVDIAGFFYIIEGEVDVIIDGKYIVTLSKGRYFGETSLLQNLPRNATVRTRTACSFVQLTRAAFVKLMTLTPEVNNRLKTLRKACFGYTTKHIIPLSHTLAAVTGDIIDMICSHVEFKQYKKGQVDKHFDIDILY